MAASPVIVRGAAAPALARSAIPLTRYERRKILIRLGVCPRCGAYHSDPYYYCFQCRVSESARRRRRYALGPTLATDGGPRMDDRDGQLYATREEALAAGVPKAHIRRLRVAYIDALHCAACGKPVKARSSTPTKQGRDGRTYRWCKRCWYRGRA